MSPMLALLLAAAAPVQRAELTARTTDGVRVSFREVRPARPAPGPIR